MSSRASGRIGWFLVWAVVFCDIGTSVYYVPGLLYGSTGDQAGVFVALTMVGFVLLSAKIVEVTRRFSQGGGVVSVADEALGPWWGCLGGQLIVVDYYLTAAISAASGAAYIDSAYDLGSGALPLTLGFLGLLALLNIVGIRESARASAVLAVSAIVVDLAVIAVAALSFSPATWAKIVGDILATRDLPLPALLFGYSGAWLAFSGLESLSQLAPAMRDLDATPRKGMIAVVLTVICTVPLLTFFAVGALPSEVKAHESERFISELALLVGGPGFGLLLKLAVVLSASALLGFAANTAIIGNYHVQVALTRKRFLPAGVASLSRQFQTPWVAILVSTVVPGVVLVLAGNNMIILGELYAFGLLGAFVLTSLGIDVLRWREGRRDLVFWLGVLTTLAVMLAFGVNLVSKPMATAFGGGITAFGLLIALATRRDWFARVLARWPRLAPPAPVEVEGRFLTVEQAVAEAVDGGILVASRGASAKLFKEAVERARMRGLDRVFVLYVDEVPGLFYPQFAAPTPEGATVLEASALHVEALGLRCVPVWAISHDAAATTAELAVRLRCDAVVVGATQRGLLWTALRGKYIQSLLRRLPADIRVVVVG